MKSIIKWLVCFLCITLNAHAQWSQVAFNNERVSLLKSVNGYLYAYAFNPATFNGNLYRSSDDGVTWQHGDSTVFQFTSVRDITYDSTHNMYVAITLAQHGVLTSADGISFTNTTPLAFGDGITYINNRLVASAVDGGGVIVSSDGGNSWSLSNTGLPGPFYVHYVTRINDTLYLSNQGTPVYISTDGGSSWTAHSDSLIYFDNCYFEHQGIVYSGLYLNGVAKYENGQWSSYNDNLPATDNIYALNDVNDTLFCGGDSTGVWMNQSGTWQSFSCGLPNSETVYKLYRSNNILFAGTEDGIWEVNLTTGCGNVGIADATSSSLVEVFPTISRDVVNIYSSATPQLVIVMNAEGEVVESLEAKSEIDVRHFSPGFYILQIKMNDHETVVKKFMVE